MPIPTSTSPESPQRPTIRQIAAAAGVSAMTVSRALRNSPRVTPELRSRIQKTADKLGYRPDPTVTKLMNHLRSRNKTNLVAALAAITSLPEELETHQSRKVWMSARERAESLGYRLELFRVADPEQRNRQLERTLISRGIEGVLLMQMERPVSVDRLLNWDKFSAAVVSPSVLSPDFQRVAANHFHNARLLCAELAKRGRKRIGFVGSDTFCVRTHDAFTAAAAWQNLLAGGEPLRPLVFESHPAAIKALPGWFALERPDAIIVHFENVLPLLEEALGIRPGGPVSVSCSSVSSEETDCPGIDERHELIGRKAVDVLTGMLNRSEKNARTTHSNTLIDGRWIEAVAKAGARKRGG